MSAAQADRALLIIDPGTRHPELGCVQWLCREARSSGLEPSLCLPALPELVSDASEALGALIESSVMTLSDLWSFDASPDTPYWTQHCPDPDAAVAPPPGIVGFPGLQMRDFKHVCSTTNVAPASDGSTHRSFTIDSPIRCFNA